MILNLVLLGTPLFSTIFGLCRTPHLDIDFKFNLTPTVTHKSIWLLFAIVKLDESF